MELNETDKYILDCIKKWVWSGFYTDAEINEMIDDILEEDAHEAYLRESIKPEFLAKFEAEKLWPEETDWERLDSVFNKLNDSGIICLHNAGYTMSDGHDDAREVYSASPEGKYFGYCFYHGQDVDRAIDGGGLMLAFDHVDGDVPDKEIVGLRIREELESRGFQIEWNGSPDKRIHLPSFDWKKRSIESNKESKNVSKKSWWKIW